MALIDTSKAANTWLDSVKDTVQALRLALVEELAATNTYDMLACGVRRSGVKVGENTDFPSGPPPGRLSEQEAENIALAIEEIRDDEMRHTGELLEIIDRIDATVRAMIQEGRQEL